MKKNENFETRAKEFIDSLKDDESAVLICSNDDGDFFYSSYATKLEIAASIATILHDHFDDGNEKAEAIAEGVVIALSELVKLNTKAGLMIARAVASAASESVTETLKKLLSKLKDVTNDDNDKDKDKDDEDDTEDCENCDEVKTCPLPQAVKYRNENGIKKCRHKKDE